jgi:RimJ/RimL family protein N-acetyltransferase
MAHGGVEVKAAARRLGARRAGASRLPGGVIVTDRLLLRPLGAEDAPIVAQAVLASLPELLPFMGWVHAAYALDDAELWIEHAVTTWASGKEFSFGVFSLGSLVGVCGLDRIDVASRSANLGYWLRTDAVGRGYATEAARALARWGFNVHGLQRIEVVVVVGNERSERAAERMGATRECVARNRLTVRGEPRDATVFSLVPRDLGA